MTLGLPGRVEPGVDKDAQIADLRQRLFNAEEDLRLERAKTAGFISGLTNLRETLAPLHHGLKLIFGELDAMGVTVGQPAAVADSRTGAVWEDWKKKFPGWGAKIIDALLLHGQMTQDQIRIAVGSRSSGTMSNTMTRLNKAGLLVKNGRVWSLKGV